MRKGDIEWGIWNIVIAIVAILVLALIAFVLIRSVEPSAQGVESFGQQASGVLNR